MKIVYRASLTEDEYGILLACYKLLVNIGNECGFLNHMTTSIADDLDDFMRRYTVESYGNNEYGFAEDEED